MNVNNTVADFTNAFPRQNDDLGDLFKAAQSMSPKELDEYVTDEHVQVLGETILFNQGSPGLTDPQKRFVENIMELTTEKRVALLQICENRFLAMQAKGVADINSMLPRFRIVLSRIIYSTFQSEQSVAEFAAQASPSLLALSLSCIAEFFDDGLFPFKRLIMSAAFKNFGAALFRRNDFDAVIDFRHKLSTVSFENILGYFGYVEKDLMAIVEKSAKEGKPTETLLEMVFKSCAFTMSSLSSSATKLLQCSDSLRKCFNRTADIFKDQELEKIQGKCLRIIFFGFSLNHWDYKLKVIQISKPLAEAIFTADVTVRAGLIKQFESFKREDLQQMEWSKAIPTVVHSWLEFKFANEFFVGLAKGLIVPPTILSEYLTANDQTVSDIVKELKKEEPKKEIPISNSQRWDQSLKAARSVNQGLFVKLPLCVIANAFSYLNQRDIKKCYLLSRSNKL